MCGLSIKAAHLPNLDLHRSTTLLYTHGAIAKLEEELKAEPYFNTTKFPAMTFVATKIERTGDTTGKITGDFTMLGVTRSVTLDATFIGGGEHPMMKTPTLGFSATGSLKRSAFGLEKLIPMVGDDVTFDVQAEFNKR